MVNASALKRELRLNSWRPGDGAPPAWLRPAIKGSVQPNGTFLVSTPLGDKRVHPDHVVVEQGGAVYAWSAAEIEERVSELQESLDAGSRVLNTVGPGKSLRTAAPRKRKGSAAQPSQRSYGPVHGTPPSIEWVAIGDLHVDADYQRSTDTDPSRRLIASIASHWDWRLCMPLAVSRRVEGRYVIDGQHRLAAARLRPDIPHLPCCIASYEGPADEAAMFVAANRSRRAISRLDDFHAALVAGDEDAIEVNRVVRAAGLRVSRKTGSQSWAPGEVAFTSSIQSVLGKHGEALVTQCLRALAQGFEGQVLSQGASLFLGLTRILIAPPDRLDRDRLFRALRTRDMASWGKEVEGMKGNDLRSQTMRTAILAAYDQLGDRRASMH